MPPLRASRSLRISSKPLSLIHPRWRQRSRSRSSRLR